MASTAVTICNRALSEIGARASIVNLNEASKEATTCKLHYDSVRKGLLRSAHWGFARTLVTLTQIGTLEDGTSSYPWLYKYAYPADCLKMRYLLRTPFQGDTDTTVTLVGDSLSPNIIAGPNRANRFLIGNDNGDKVIYTNVYQAIGVYTGDITDPAQFDQGFDDALVAALAAKLVIPMSGNVQMKGTFENLAFSIVRQARAADGNEAQPTTDHTPDWIKARTDGFVPLGIDGPGYWYQSWDNVSWGE